MKHEWASIRPWLNHLPTSPVAKQATVWDGQLGIAQIVQCDVWSHELRYLLSGGRGGSWRWVEAHPQLLASSNRVRGWSRGWASDRLFPQPADPAIRQLVKLDTESWHQCLFGTAPNPICNGGPLSHLFLPSPSDCITPRCLWLSSILPKRLLRMKGSHTHPFFRKWDCILLAHVADWA